jgi:hypothetical protein
MNIFGLPQPLTGSETVTIHQQQNGQLAQCTMPISQLASYFNYGIFANLQTTKPSEPGIPWNDNGVVSIS